MRVLPGVTPRLAVLAIVYGGIAGLVAALTFTGMTALQSVVWDTGAQLFGTNTTLQIVTTILLGGALLIVLDRAAPSEDLQTLLRQSGDPAGLPRRAILTTALAAIVAVAFGGAVGPEAGIVAVVAQLSTIVAHLIGEDVAMRRTIGEAGSAGALGGFYGSPPGAAAIDGDELGPRKVLQLGAGFAGFFAFLAFMRLTPDTGGATITLPAVDLPYVDPWLIGIAVVAALAGLLFRGLHHAIDGAVSRIRRPWIVIALGTVLFAALAAVVPLVRFSGHHELHDLQVLTEAGDWSTLLVVAIAKIAALTLCLVSGWRGGEFFPLVFIGAAIGGAVAVLVPGLEIGAAMATGMAATTAVGWKRPLAVLLILILLVDVPMAFPLLIGVGVAFLVNLLVSRRGGTSADSGSEEAGAGSSDPNDADGSRAAR